MTSLLAVWSLWIILSWFVLPWKHVSLSVAQCFCIILWRLSQLVLIVCLKCVACDLNAYVLTTWILWVWVSWLKCEFLCMYVSLCVCMYFVCVCVWVSEGEGGWYRCVELYEIWVPALHSSLWHTNTHTLFHTQKHTQSHTLTQIDMQYLLFYLEKQVLLPEKPCLFPLDFRGPAIRFGLCPLHCMDVVLKIHRFGLSVPHKVC